MNCAGVMGKLTTLLLLLSLNLWGIIKQQEEGHIETKVEVNANKGYLVTPKPNNEY